MKIFTKEWYKFTTEYKEKEFSYFHQAKKDLPKWYNEFSIHADQIVEIIYENNLLILNMKADDDKRTKYQIKFHQPEIIEDCKLEYAWCLYDELYIDNGKCEYHLMVSDCTENILNYFTVKCSDMELVRNDKSYRILGKSASDSIYNNQSDDFVTLDEKVVNKLIEKGYHISFAESCTGGLCCGALVNVANASKVLDVSFTTYANEAKIKFLGVKEDTISKHGVVSEEVAYEMAVGVAKAVGSEIGVGITGIAGPGGGTEKKPVGMVCFGFNINGKVNTFTQYFGEIGRNQVRQFSVEFVFSKLNELL